MLVYKKISAVTADIYNYGGIGKNQKNSHQGYQFRGIDDIYNALAPILSSHELVILPRVVNSEYKELTTAKGQPQRLCVLHIEYDIVASEDGSKHTVAIVGEALDTSDKATNKAMAIAYKYMAIQAFCLPIVGADDPDSVTHEIGKSVKVAQTQKKLPTAKWQIEDDDHLVSLINDNMVKAVDATELSEGYRYIKNNYELSEGYLNILNQHGAELKTKLPKTK